MELFLNDDMDSYFLKMVVFYTKTSSQLQMINLSQPALQLAKEGIIKLPSIPSLIIPKPGLITNLFSIAQ